MFYSYILYRDGKVYAYGITEPKADDSFGDGDDKFIEEER